MRKPLIILLRSKISWLQAQSLLIGPFVVVAKTPWGRTPDLLTKHRAPAQSLLATIPHFWGPRDLILRLVSSLSARYPYLGPTFRHVSWGLAFTWQVCSHILGHLPELQISVLAVEAYPSCTCCVEESPGKETDLK